MNIFNFIIQTINKGGASYNPEFGTVPESGYMVSIRDVIKVSFDNKEETVQDAVWEALKQSGDLLAHPDNFLGSWVSDDDYLYIDVARNLQDIRPAIELGMIDDQLAIYDIGKDREIKLPARQKAGTYTQQKTYMDLAIDKIINNLK